MQEEPSRRENKPGMSRRGFLTAAGAIAAPIVVGGGIILHEHLTRPTPDKYESYLYARKKRMHLDEMSRLSPEKREHLIDAEVARVREVIESAEGKRILESGSDDELWSLITMMPPILRDDIRGTRFDVNAREWPSVLMTPSNNAMPKTLDLRTSRQDRPSEYANGFYIGRNDFVTNLHAVSSFVRDIPNKDALRINRMHLAHNLDIVHIEMPEERVANIPTKILPVSGTSKNLAHCRLVTIAGIDRDKTADADDTKLYPSMAIRITPRLAELFTSVPKGDSYGKYVHAGYTNSYMVLLPPGETESPDGRTRSPSAGMSGSPVLSSGTLAGIFHSSTNGRFVRNGIWYNIGFLHGSDEITKARELGMTYKVPEQQG